MIKSFIFLFFIFTSAVGVSATSNLAKSKDQKTVDLQLEEVAGATQYEIEVVHKKTNQVFSQSSSTALMSIQLPAGTYSLRARVADSRGAYSEWSKISDFSVTFEAINLQEDQTPAIVSTTPESSEAKIDLKWQKAEGTAKYKIQLYDSTGATVQESEVTMEKFQAELPPGEYSYSITKIGTDGVESAPVRAKKTIKVNPVAISAPVVEEPVTKSTTNYIAFKGHPKAELFARLEYSPFLSDSWKIISEGKQSGGMFTISKTLPPGQYRLSLWATGKGWLQSEIVEKRFIIKPTENDL